jgi:hypothetical protein
MKEAVFIQSDLLRSELTFMNVSSLLKPLPIIAADH